VQEIGGAAVPHDVRSFASFFRPLAIFVILFILLGGSHAAAQAVRLIHPRPRPQLFIFLSLTVSASPTAVSFALVHGGAATASAPVAVTTSYVSAVSLNGSLTLYAYFSSPTSALTGGAPSSSIPSSDIFGQVTTGTPTSYTAFSQTTPYSGASGLQLFNTTTIAFPTASRTDNLNLKIDLTATPQLPAATYTGTLTLEAQSF
jgi:hypothetical protein